MAMMSDDYLKWYAAVDDTIAMVRMVERREFNASASAVLMLAGLSPPTDGQSSNGFRSDIINPFCDVTTNCFSLINALVVMITLPTIGGCGITSIVGTPFL
jgi:hypothetical protein